LVMCSSPLLWAESVAFLSPMVLVRVRSYEERGEKGEKIVKLNVLQTLTGFSWENRLLLACSHASKSKRLIPLL
jgi:hypothetical protein